MKLLDLLIVSFFPRYGLRRLQAQQAVKAYYEGGRPSGTLPRRVTNEDPDTEVGEAALNMRASARHLQQNYDVAKGVLDVLAANIVGMGIQPIPGVKKMDGSLHKEANKAILNLYKDWERKPEVTWDFDNGTAQSMACKTWLRDGEVLTQLLMGNVRGLDHGTKVPFSYELIEADYLPMDFDDERRGIAQGVQKNKWGRAVRYHIYKDIQSSVNMMFTDKATKSVPADKMVHLKLVNRIRQTRGVSVFSTVMKRFEDIKDIEESERVAARVAAAIAGFIKKGSPDMYIRPEDGDEREMEFMPGMIFDDLHVGEEVTTTSSNRPNNDVIPFLDANMRFAAAGTSTAFSSIAKNYNGTYSAQRQELVEQYNNYGVLWQYFTGRQVHPIYEKFLLMAWTSGLLDKFTDIDEDTLYDVQFTRPPLTWIDPAKEMTGIEKELSTGVASKTGVIRRRNGDPEEVLQQRIEEATAERDSGLLQETQDGQTNQDQDQDQDD